MSLALLPATKVVDPREVARTLAESLPGPRSMLVARGWVPLMVSWSPPEPRYRTGVFAKYAAQVTSASEGAITRP